MVDTIRSHASLTAALANNATGLITAQVVRDFLETTFAFGAITPGMYGAKGDGATDDTTAIQAALNAAAGGTVFFPKLSPSGYYMVSSGLTVPGFTTLFGSRGASIRKMVGATAPLLTIAGTDVNTRNVGVTIRDLTLDGGAQAGTLITATHVSQLTCSNVVFTDASGGSPGLDATDLWDSRFNQCFWDWCGGYANAGVPAVRLRNLATATANINAICFSDCRWESFGDGALHLSRNAGSETLAQIYLVNCKMETSNVIGPFLKCASNEVVNLHAKHLYLAANSFYSGFSTPVNMIEFGPYSASTLENVTGWIGQSSLIRTVVRATVGQTNCAVRDVSCQYAGAGPTVAIVERTGGINPITDNITYVGSAAVAPTLV